MPDITGALTRSTFDVIQLRGEYMVVGAETIYVYTRDHNGYVLSAAGLTVPTTATAGYAKGATFIKTDAADGTQGLYQNKGTTTSCTFELIQPGGGGGVGSLDDAYSNGSTITMDAGPVALNDATAGTSQMLVLTKTAAGSGNMLDINCTTAASTGNLVDLTTGTNLAGNALAVTTAGVRTAPVMYINGAATDAGTDDHVLFIAQSGLLDSNLIQLTYSVANSAGDALGITMATALAGRAISISGTGNRTGDLIDISSDDTGSGHVMDINMSGAGSGNVLDITFSAAAHTGDAISLAMGTNVGGQAITISSAATGVANEGSALQVAHTGNLVANANLVQIISTGNHDASSDVVYLEQSTGAGTAGTTLLRLNATGANVEALAINAGLAFLSAETATPGSGDDETLPITSNVVFYDPNGASRAGIILSAGLREGQTITVVNIADAAETITFAAAAVSNVAGGASVSIARFECLTLVWNVATTKWYCMGAGL